MIESILKNELYMGYIFGIMILGGFIREYHVLEDVYSLAKKYVKDNRVLIMITSLLGGVLPIPGRVALSAPLLDAIAPEDKKKRSAYGNSWNLICHISWLCLDSSGNHDWIYLLVYLQ